MRFSTLCSGKSKLGKRQGNIEESDFPDVKKTLLNKVIESATLSSSCFSNCNLTLLHYRHHDCCSLFCCHSDRC